MENDDYLQKYAEVYTAQTPRKKDVLTPWIVDTLHLHKPKGLLIDVGCGPAEIEGLVRNLGYSYVGIDLNPYMLIRAKNDYHSSRVLQARAENLPIKQNSASVVLMNMLVHSINSLWELNSTMEEAARVLKRDGLLVISMLNEKKTEKLLSTARRRQKDTRPKAIKFPVEFLKGD